MVARLAGCLTGRLVGDDNDGNNDDDYEEAEEEQSYIY